MSASAAVAARATTLVALGRAQEALELLGPALAQEPDSSRLLCLTARAHLACGDPASALAAANSAVAADPEGEWGHRLASLALTDVGHPQEAVRAAYEATRLAPAMWQTHHCLAMALSRNGQHEGALASAHNAIRIAPNQHQTHFALGYAALNAGHKTLAHDAFKHVLALDPDNSAAHNNLAKLGMDQGRLLRAAHGFSASLAANPHSATARYNVDVLARHLMRWVHYAMLGLCLLLEAFVPQDTTDPTGPLPIADAPPGSGATTAPNTHATASSGWLALLTPALFVAFVGAVVVLDRRLPRALRGYYRRLPRTDRYLGAWLALDLIAFGLLLALGIPQSPTNRSGLDGFAFMVLIAGVLVSRVGASHMKKRRAALPS